MNRSIRRQRRSSRRAQSGVGLIEVLVAVLVLSIGFLGVAALQAMSLSTNNSAMARSMATISSYSILDAMRADISGAQAGNYTTTVTADSCPDPETTSLASGQIKQWCIQLGHNLGATRNTTGKIDCGTSSPVVCTVTIQFDDSRAAVGGAPDQTVTTKAVL